MVDASSVCSLCISPLTTHRRRHFRPVSWRELRSLDTFPSPPLVGRTSHYRTPSAFSRVRLSSAASLAWVSSTRTSRSLISSFSSPLRSSSTAASRYDGAVFPFLSEVVAVQGSQHVGGCCVFVCGQVLHCCSWCLCVCADPRLQGHQGDVHPPRPRHDPPPPHPRRQAPRQRSFVHGTYFSSL